MKFSIKSRLLQIPEGVGSSLTIAASSSCWKGASRIVSTRWTGSRWKWKLFRIESLLKSSINVCEPTLIINKQKSRKFSVCFYARKNYLTFGTLLNTTTWLSASLVLLRAKALNKLICRWHIINTFRMWCNEEKNRINFIVACYHHVDRFSFYYWVKKIYISIE